MKGLKRLWGPNKLVRQKMAAANPDFAAIEPSIRSAQHTYLKGSRAPTVLAPAGISEPTATWIRGRYKSAPKELALDWIKKVRNEHDLLVCPMCGGSAVATLDHVLPKEEYPEFAVLSFNLVPSCDGCQRRRSNKGATYEFIHPYFDQSLLETLRLTVTFTPPYGAVIFKLLPTGIAGTDLQRTQRHIDECLPPKLFTREMRGLWRKWHKRFFAGAADVVQRLADDLTDAEEDAMNSWKAAFLRGLSGDAVAQAWMRSTAP